MMKCAKSILALRGLWTCREKAQGGQQIGAVLKTLMEQSGNI